MKRHVKMLKDLDACKEAVEFAAGFPSLAAAWAACDRGDWLLWYAGRLSGLSESDSRRRLVLAACECARLSLEHVPAGEDRPRLAIETAERWARHGAGITLAEVQTAADSAWDVANVADAAAAAAAASVSATAAADYAFCASNAASVAADWAAVDGAAAMAAVDGAAAMATVDGAAARFAVRSAARDAALRQCAEIMRRHYPRPPRMTR